MIKLEVFMEVIMIQEINGFNMYVEVDGKGPNLVMIHGNGEDHHSFDVLKAALRHSYRIWTYDARGHGLSDKGIKLSYKLMSQDLDAFLEFNDIRDACILGYSDGGVVSLLSSMKPNSRMKSQILLGINLSPQAFSPGILDGLKSEYKQTRDPLTLMMIHEPQIQPQHCLKVTIPTALFYGEDEPFTPESIQLVHQSIPQSTLTIVEGHTHGSYIQDSHYLEPFIKEWFKK